MHLLFDVVNKNYCKIFNLMLYCTQIKKAGFVGFFKQEMPGKKAFYLI